MAIVAVSPHLDDAALSASVRLHEAQSTVLTVFAGMPSADFTVSLWDRVTGAVRSADRQIERLAEDAKVMSLLSARGCYLDEREAQYRPSGGDGPVDPDRDGLAAKLADYFTDADEIWLPAAIGRHVDHIIARDAGLRAAATAGYSEVVLFADFPYVISYGWPAWITGAQADPYLDAEHWLSHELIAAGLDGNVRTAEVVELDPAQRTRKAEIIAAYRSQASALGLQPEVLAAEPVKLGYELSWRLRLAAKAR